VGDKIEGRGGQAVGWAANRTVEVSRRAPFFQRFGLLLALLLVAAGLALAHGPRVARNFSEQHWEDKLYFEHSRKTIGSWADCFTRPLVWPGQYRPLTTNCYYYAVDRYLGNRIQVYHAANLLLAAANGLLLFLVARRLLPGGWALAPPALFASRLAHVEVLTNTVEFQSLLSVFFSLLALRLFLLGRERRRFGLAALAGACLALALLSKETAVVVPALLLVYGWLFDDRRGWPHYLAPAAVAVVWAALFVSVLRGIGGEPATGFVYTRSAAVVLRNYAAYLLDFSNALVAPLDDVVMSGRVARLAASPWARSLFALLVALAGLAGLLLRRLPHGCAAGARTGLFGFAFFLIAAAPYVIFEDRLFMRYSYFAHAGLSLAAGAIAYELVRALRRPGKPRG
jgi:hypothetical protein